MSGYSGRSSLTPMAPVIKPLIYAPVYYPARAAYACLVEYKIDEQRYAFISLSDAILGKDKAVDTAREKAGRIIHRKLGDKAYAIEYDTTSQPSHF